MRVMLLLALLATALVAAGPTTALVPPGAPVIAGTIPAPPSNVDTPAVVGVASGAEGQFDPVAIYTNSTCTGSPVGTACGAS